MSIFPVIGRELRSQARQPVTYLLRLAGALAICLAFWLAYSSVKLPTGRNAPTLASQQLEFQNFGVALFGKMNLTIFVAIWLLAPLAAADSISRERREGTLPLLQLTRLRPWEIVLGKSFVHMLRSSTLFLTMLPWLLIPFLFGGLSLQDFGLALLLDVTALFLAQSAGLLASTFSRDWLKTVIWAQALALALLLGMMHLYEEVLEKAFLKGAAPAPWAARWGPRPTGLWSHIYRGSGGVIQKRAVLLGLLTNGTTEYQYQRRIFGNRNLYVEFRSTWQEISTALNPLGKRLWFEGALMLLAGSIGIFILSIFIGAAYVRRTWRQTSQSPAVERLRQKYFTPKYAVGTLRKRLRRSLSRNPIGWLHHYSPSARLTKWSWCLFLIVIETLLATNVHDIYTAQAGLGYLLLLGLLFSSVGSFRDELETGAFELLLVTPIREAQILFGRVAGIWQQFLPAFVIYGAGVLFLGAGWTDDRTAKTAQESVVRFALLSFSAPFIGLYFSLLRWNFLVAWICASLVVIAAPLLFSRAGLSILFIPLILAAIFAWRTRSRLQNRLALAVR